MKYIITSADQISNFLSALGLGFIICLVYLFIKFIRKIISTKKWTVILQDAVFSVLTSLLTFVFFQIQTEGQVRGDLIISSAIGFSALYFGAGRYIERITDKISCRSNKIKAGLASPVIFIKKIFIKSKKIKNFT